MKYYYPDEKQRHCRTWLSFCVNHNGWQDETISCHIQKNIAQLCLAIAGFESVNLLVRSNELPLAKKLMGNEINYIEADLDDIWLRDNGAVFVRDRVTNEKVALDFNFNGWGKRQPHQKDKRAAQIMAEYAGVPLCKADITLEGGALEVNGCGNAILNESCIINDNRNPGWSKERCERSLSSFLGLENITWLPGKKDSDITDSHIDFYAKFTSENEIVINKNNNPAHPDYGICKSTCDILSQIYALEEVNILTSPEKFNVDTKYFPEFAASYINYYVCNGGVILPLFGDDSTDRQAREKVQHFYPDREIIQINIDAIASGGGGIHCVTQQEYAV